jgi:hypothetical protein
MLNDNPFNETETNFDEVDEVYIPAPNLPQPVDPLKNLRSNEVLMIEHRAHLESVQSFVDPLSPMLHFLRVPCHRRFSFPGDLPIDTKLPLASTLLL